MIEKFRLENPICSAEITYQVGTTASKESLIEGSKLFEIMLGESTVGILPRNITSFSDIFSFYIFTSSGEVS